MNTLVGLLETKYFSHGIMEATAWHAFHLIRRRWRTFLHFAGKNTTHTKKTSHRDTWKARGRHRPIGLQGGGARWAPPPPPSLTRSAGRASKKIVQKGLQ